MSESILPFLGRFHPLIVHLPIGFLSFWVVFEIFYRKSEKSGVRLLLASFTFLSSSTSVILGFFLSWQSGYDEHLLEDHRNSGILLAILSFLLLITIVMYNNGLFFRRLYYPLLIVSFAVLCYTGHHGGSLTHGSDFLVYKPELNPANEQTLKIADIKKAYVFEDLVLPILKKKCTSCHNNEKKKGGLQLDTYGSIMKGGENGQIIVPGNSAESYMAEVILMHKDEEMAMPPKGKQPLTQAEMQVIIWWIDQNAKENTKVEQLVADNKTLTAINSVAGNEIKTTSFWETTEAEPVNLLSVEFVKKSGFLVYPIAANSNLLEIRIQASATDTLSDNALIALQSVNEQLVWLDLSKSKITDDAGSIFAQFKHLNKLNVSNTEAGDKIAQSIASLPALQIVNFTGTPISIKGLVKLIANPSIQKIYVWKTTITEADISALQIRYPKLQIELGSDSTRSL